MNFVKSLNLLGVEGKEIPCVTGNGAPTETTEGAVGSFYMDTNNGTIYKCISANNNSYIWAKELPAVTTDDAGKFLRVSATGVWEPQTIENGNEVAY